MENNNCHIRKKTSDDEPAESNWSDREFLMVEIANLIYGYNIRVGDQAVKCSIAFQRSISPEIDRYRLDLAAEAFFPLDEE